MDKWECTVCGYTYDSDIGDLTNNIVSGIPFEELEDEWKCPVCDADKEDFVKIE